MKAYLYWRCKTNWHNKYLKYIDEWVSNVTPTQLEYFKLEKERLTNRDLYYENL